MNVCLELIPGTQRRLLDELRRERAGSGRDYSGWNGHWQMRVQGHPINEVRMRVRLFKTMTDPAGDGRVAGPSECTEAFRQSQLAELRSEPAFLNPKSYLRMCGSRGARQNRHQHIQSKTIPTAISRANGWRPKREYWR